MVGGSMSGMSGSMGMTMAAGNRHLEIHVASRATEPRRYRTPQELHDVLAPHGEVETAELDVTAGYRDFDEFWQAMGRGVGPAGQWVASLDDETRERARDELLGQDPGELAKILRALAREGAEDVLAHLRVVDKDIAA